MEYPKIETLFDRNPENMKHVIPGALRKPEFGLINSWMVTEKIDGTNVRVMLENGVLGFGGKTDAASMPMPLLNRLGEIFAVDKMTEVFSVDSRVVLYGEGFGAKIQKGGVYRPDQGFRLFDVAIFGDDGHGGSMWWWLEWANVEEIASLLGISTVPVIANGVSLEEASSLVAMPSTVAAEDGGDHLRNHEGIVARTTPLLRTRNGDRLLWKLKGRDLPD